jgi:LPXTG-motif cell wall-anchored protein
MPARRSAAAIGAAVALAAGTLALAPSAQATTAGGSDGQSATATVLRTNLDVSVQNTSVKVPVNVVLNDVHAPADAHRTTLSVQLAGINGDQSFNVLDANVANTRATAHQRKAEGYANLVNAKVNLPGLSSPLAEARLVNAQATCEAGKQPTVSANPLGDIFVLGKKIDVTVAKAAPVPVKVDVPNVGEVTVTLRKTETTSRTDAKAAVDLDISLEPTKPGVVGVKGDITLAEATCKTPQGGGSSTGGSTSGATGGGSTSGASNGGSTSGASNGGSTSGASNGGSTSGATGGGSTTGATGGGSTTGASQGTSSGAATAGSQSAGTGKNLAETGASSSTPYIAGGAAALLVAGGAAVYVTRRRKSSATQG